MTTDVACKTCGDTVTAKDPVRYPYCRTCHYTGIAAEDVRAAQLARLAAALPGATVRVEHTGGGCFWIAIRWPDESPYYVLTDGDAGLPTDDDGDPVPEGGWGYVGRHDDREDSPDYQGTELFWNEREGDRTDAQAVALILTDHGAPSIEDVTA